MGTDLRRRTPSDDADIDPPPSYWEQIAEDAEWGGGGRFWRAYCDRLYDRLIGEWIGDLRYERALKTDLFDEVCGRGLVGTMGRLATAVHGIDISSRVAAKARAERPQLRCCVSDVRRLGFADDSFDLVLSNSTLDHFSARADIHRALEEIVRVLRPDGRLMITLDNLANPVVALRSVLPQSLLHRLFLVPYFTGVTLTLRGLVRELDGFGLRIADRRTLMHVPRLPTILWGRRRWRTNGRESIDSWVGSLESWEQLDKLPTRHLTGYYIAVLAEQP